MVGELCIGRTRLDCCRGDERAPPLSLGINEIN